MNRFDFTPYRRSTVGFDRLFDLLERQARVNGGDNYPPFNIERRGEDAYRITLAVAGFKPEDLDITAQQNLLVIQGRKRDEAVRRRVPPCRHRQPRLRAPLRARRLRPGRPRRPCRRPAGHRPRARSARGDEAEEDPRSAAAALSVVDSRRPDHQANGNQGREAGDPPSPVPTPSKWGRTCESRPHACRRPVRRVTVRVAEDDHPLRSSRAPATFPTGLGHVHQRLAIEDA